MFARERPCPGRRRGRRPTHQYARRAVPDPALRPDADRPARAVPGVRPGRDHRPVVALRAGDRRAGASATRGGPARRACAGAGADHRARRAGASSRALMALGVGGYGTLPMRGRAAGRDRPGRLRGGRGPALLAHPPRRFRAVSQVQIVQSVVRAVSQVVFGLLGGGVLGLLVSEVLGRVAGPRQRRPQGVADARGGACESRRSRPGPSLAKYWRFPVVRGAVIVAERRRRHAPGPAPGGRLRPADRRPVRARPARTRVCRSA